MAFQRKIWENRIVETPNRRKLIDTTTQEEKIVDITREEGEVVVVGDKFDEANMNNLELRIKEGFDTLAPVAKTGKYDDLTGKPTAFPANGGEADKIKGIGDANAIKNLIKSEQGSGNIKNYGYEESEDILFDNPFHTLYYPKNPEEDIPISIARYDRSKEGVPNGVISAINFEKDGMEFFNAKIQPTETVMYTDDMNNAGFITKFEDGSTIAGKALIKGGVFQGIQFNNGKIWTFAFESGPMPNF